jgi:hippurate hydrolase
VNASGGGVAAEAADTVDASTAPSPVDDLIPDLVELRHDLHAHPELAFEERRTAGRVATLLRLIGLQVHEGLGGTGVVGSLTRGDGGRRVGLRADMDALPMVELGTPAYRSTHAGVHHGCGHDGHTAMLLGAARQLARLPGWQGTVHLIFQPAEEGRGGGRVMVEQGLFERFDCDAVYALHNWPGLPIGHAQTRPGPIMAAADRFDIVLRGRGGHAAQPHRTPDVLLAAAELVVHLNTLVARRIDPAASAVLSVTRVQGGQSHNVLPAEAVVTGTVRTFDPAVQNTLEAALRDAADGLARAAGVQAEVRYDRYYPATVNTEAETALALDAAREVGLQVDLAPAPAYTSEDFAFMLRARPGAYLWLGQGRPGVLDDPPLHHPCYDFNDAALPLGVRWLCEVALRELRRAG